MCLHRAVSNEPASLPADLAAAHAMILAERSARRQAEAMVSAATLEIERLKLLLAKARREQFGQTSERGKRLIDQLELQLAELEESRRRGRGWPPKLSLLELTRWWQPMSGRSLRDGPCLPICRASGSSSRRPPPAAAAAATGSPRLARWSPRRSTSSRGAGSCDRPYARSSPAATARRSPSRRRRSMSSRAPGSAPACWR